MVGPDVIPFLSESRSCPPTYSRTRASRFKRTGKRNEIFLATKFGAGSPSGKIIDGSPAYVKEACNKSLAKLGVDYIDLFYAHR
jgi:aryl-alcohol dehydrogenase-like predicted oxidoreductase